MSQCLTCNATLSADDKFCESCGNPVKPLTPETASHGCEKCGAEITEIDADGYCIQCGFRQNSPTRDHWEILISSDLAGVSDRGFRHHRNEDFLSLAQVDGIPAQILVVCDGVSSSDQPDLASRTAAESTCQYLTTIREDELPAAVITSSVAHALKSVCDIPLRPGVNADSPSTTLVTAVVMNGIATIGWLGDSRAYWISDHSCQQLTTDHSWVTEAVAAGEMTLEEAEKSPYAHAITRWIGVDAVTDPIPSILNFVIPHPGYILLCTDGLWNYAPEAQDLAELVKQSSGKDAITISRFLVEFARNQGGHDNITVGILIV